MVSILDDLIPEDMLEYFSLILTSTDPAVTLNPMIANVTIIDDMDSKYHPDICSELSAYTYIVYCTCVYVSDIFSPHLQWLQLGLTQYRILCLKKMQAVLLLLYQF